MKSILEDEPIPIPDQVYFKIKELICSMLNKDPDFRPSTE
jgi:hypothetical protein